MKIRLIEMKNLNKMDFKELGAMVLVGALYGSVMCVTEIIMFKYCHKKNTNPKDEETKKTE